MTDRRTGIDGDQITDETILSEECKFENSPTDDAIVGVNTTSKEFKYLNFPKFGQNFQEASSLGITSTTSTDYVQKLRMTTPSLPIGKYRIGVSYAWRKNSTFSDFLGRVQVNDTTTLIEHAQEPKEKDVSQKAIACGFAYYEVTSAEILNIDLDFATESSQQADISYARLEIWRVS